MNTEDISIIVVSYFTGEVLFDCIESCRKMSGIKEVILVNNGNTTYAINRLKWLENTGEIKIIDGHGNIGFAKACNLGAKLATGSYLMFVNPDCYTNDISYALKLKKALEENSKYWFATSLILNSDGSIQKTCRRNLMTPLNAISQSFGLSIFGLPSINRDVSEIKKLSKISEIEAFSGALFFASKESYFKVGGLSEEYFLHVEDMDLSKKIALAGGKICFVKDAIIYHKLSTSDVTSKFLELHKTKSFIVYLQKFFPICRKPIIKQILSMAIWIRYYLKTFYK